jgi:hypothetical protein
MKRRIGLVAAFSVSCLALFGLVGRAVSTTQTRVCPIPVVGGDPDSVQLNGPTTTPVAGQPVTYTVTADESPGEGSHVVTLRVAVSSSDGGQATTDAPNGVASRFSPTTITLTLDPGHHYTVDWTATFDFGIHPCSSAQPDQSSFDVAS